jgi:APA family basic amino acid/polyamine antiporter
MQPAPSRIELRRSLGLMSATALVVSNMIGTAIFTSTGFMAGDLGSAGLILLAWTVGAAFAFCGALTYSELAINHPQSGGEYVYLTKAYGPSWGFMSGWVSFFAGFSAPIAAAALAFSAYLSHFFPALDQSRTAFTMGSGNLAVKVGGAQLAACALIGLFTLLNCLRVETVAKVQNSLTSLKVVVILAFILCGLTVGTGSWSHFSTAAVRTSTTPLPAQFLVSLLWVMVGYSGWNAATYVAEEVRQPERTLPRALALGAGLVALLYLGLNVVFIYATPLESMKGKLAVGEQAAKGLFGADVAGTFSALMALAIMSTVNAMVTAGPRVYYAMAKNRAFPSFARKISPRSYTPVRSVMAQSVCAMLMTFTSFPDLMVFIGFTLTLFTMLAVASVFVFRRKASWKRLGSVNFAYPLIPLAYTLLGTGMTVYGLVEQPVASVASLVMIGAGALVYRFTVVKDGHLSDSGS